MMTVSEHKRFIKYPDDDKTRIIAEIYADDVSELPEIDSIDGCELAQGSVAYVIKSGGLYILGGDGKWYDNNGKEA
ncbi:MAG: hypothetical protein K2I80_10415 [Ruminococcus sp.]|nr:hypothetical protein [Ruminococcus sp.]